MYFLSELSSPAFFVTSGGGYSRFVFPCMRLCAPWREKSMVDLVMILNCALPLLQGMLWLEATRRIWFLESAVGLVSIVRFRIGWRTQKIKKLLKVPIFAIFERPGKSCTHFFSGGKAAEERPRICVYLAICTKVISGYSKRLLMHTKCCFIWSF